MKSHTFITLPWMLLGWVLSWFTSPWMFVVFAAFITGWWWSREQYWMELEWRKLRPPQDTPADVIKTLFLVWVWTEKNMDLIAPAITAWGMVILFLLIRSL